MQKKIILYGMCVLSVFNSSFVFAGDGIERDRMSGASYLDSVTAEDNPPSFSKSRIISVISATGEKCRQGVRYLFSRSGAKEPNNALSAEQSAINDDSNGGCSMFPEKVAENTLDSGALIALWKSIGDENMAWQQEYGIQLNNVLSELAKRDQHIDDLVQALRQQSMLQHNVQHQSMVHEKNEYVADDVDAASGRLVSSMIAEHANSDEGVSDDANIAGNVDHQEVALTSVQNEHVADDVDAASVRLVSSTIAEHANGHESVSDDAKKQPDESQVCTVIRSDSIEKRIESFKEREGYQKVLGIIKEKITKICALDNIPPDDTVDLWMSGIFLGVRWEKINVNTASHSNKLDAAKNSMIAIVLNLCLCSDMLQSLEEISNKKGEGYSVGLNERKSKIDKALHVLFDPTRSKRQIMSSFKKALCRNRYYSDKEYYSVVDSMNNNLKDLGKAMRHACISCFNACRSKVSNMISGIFQDTSDYVSNVTDKVIGVMLGEKQNERL